MSNCYGIATAEQSVKCSQEDFDKLAAILRDDRTCLHGFSVEFMNSDSIYLYSEENCTLDELPYEFLKCFGELIKRNGLKYLEVGIAFYSDRPEPDSSGGMRFRIYPDGTIVCPELNWPNYYPTPEDELV